MDRKSNSWAYGFRLVPVDPTVVLPDLPEDADGDEVGIEWRTEAASENVAFADEHRAQMSARGGGSFQVQRDPRHISLSLPDPVTAAAIVHPLITAPVAILARWRGDATLHAGAVAIAGGAYAVCGTQEAGKSSMLAALAARGLPVVADDLLVVRDGMTFAGPNCVDLRPDTAARYGARPIGKVGERSRYRMATPPSESRLPLRGVFVLEWGEGHEPEVAPLSTFEKLRLLHGQEYAPIAGPPQPKHVFDLIEMPMWHLRRPRVWSQTDITIDCLMAVAGAH